MVKPSCKFCPEPGAFSPSQIKAFEFGCERKWAFRHICNIPEPSFAFQQLGQDVHKHLERYLLMGERPPDDTKAGQIALTGLDDLPKPNSRHLVEKHLYLEVDGVRFHGFADLIPYCEYAIDDHKTTAHFKYALAEKDLKTDPQALIYGMWLALKQPQQFREKFELALRWRYYRTKEPYKYQMTFTTLTWAEMQENFSRYVLEPAKRMRDIRDSASPEFDPNVLPANAGSCEAYGGCPHKSRCNLHKTEKVTMGSLFRDVIKDKPAAEEAPKKKSSLFGAKPAPAPALEPEDSISAVEANDQILARGVVPPDAPPPVKELPEEEPKATKGKGTRGRPKGSKNKPAATEPMEEVRSPDPREQAPQIVADGLGNAPVSDDGKPCLVLCVNTFPCKNRVTLLSEVLAPIVKELSDQLGVSHYRLAKEAEYGRADSLLLSAFKESAPELKGYVFVDTRDVNSVAVLSYLEASAVEVFRGAH